MGADDVGRTTLLVLLVVFAVIGLVAVAALVFLAIRFRPSIAAIAAIVGALIYGGSPIDLIPELFVGPIGLIDDAGVAAAVIAFVISQLRKRRQAGAGRPSPAAGRGNGPVIIRQLPDDE